MDERAIICIFDQNANPQTKQSAMNYVEQLKQRPDIWKLCMDKIFKSSSHHVLFWCFQTLATFFQKHIKQLTPHELTLIKQALPSWIRDVCVKKKVPTHIKNKFSEVLVLVFRIEYSEKRWDDFFTNLFMITTSCGEDGIDMLLRILNTIDEQVVSRYFERTKEDLARNTFIVSNFFFSLINYRKIK